MTQRRDDEAEAPGTEQPASFEQALARLGDIVSSLESGTLGLSESIDGYERGVAILRRLHEELGRAEERVSVLVKIDEEGRPVLAPLDAQPSAADQPPAKRSRAGGRGRTPPGTRALPGMDESSGEA